MKNSITYVAMDVHKKQHTIAMILPGDDEVYQWTINNDARQIKRLVNQLRKKAPGEIVICYEAGVCGFDLQRQIAGERINCQVIAPSLIPQKPGERIKTDRRDAKKLVNLLRAGMLTEVHPPNLQEEAIRDLCRLRQSAGIDLNRIRHQILKYLLRRGFIYRQSANWTQGHLRWLKAVKFTEYADKLTYSEYLSELNHRMERLEALDREVEKFSLQEPYRQAVAALRCFHGINTLTAMVVVAELHDILRFDSPDKLMSYLGLTPSENSSGDKQNRGAITKAGNSRVRKILIEASKHQQNKPVVSKALSARRKGQEAWIIKIANKCHKRLYQRYWRLINNGKVPNKATTAVARELVGFIWSILHTLAEIVPDEEAA